jgi:cysteine dioxygenase
MLVENNDFEERLSDKTDESESATDFSLDKSPKPEISDLSSLQNSTKSIDKFDTLVDILNNIFSSDSSWECKSKSITNVLKNVDLTTTEINKYTFFDAEKPYTRNLVATDGKHYTLLVLCWNAAMESKIHNHPCDGCYIKTIRGCIKETVYQANECTNEIKQSGMKFYCEGQVSYMNDDIGLHKIGNPNKDLGSVTLHLYTPPFGSCKVRKASF